MKKKIVLIAFIIIVAGATSIYFYAYKDHRDIARESADYVVSVSQMQTEFSTNDSLSYNKYQDKTIEISGKITAIDIESRGITVDEKLFATFKNALPKEISNGQLVKIKGRFLGYDDLLEEFKIDQTTIIE
ncbi:hypothetical protein [Flavobacterium sp.]|uniref:OB-fold protein n=1 Tax=Flavobacterium sp. TaxID=239 RepID=UPI0037512067